MVTVDSSQADREDRGATAPGLGKQAKVAMVAVAVVALVALLWPRGDGSFEAPGGFLYEPDGRPAKLGDRFAPVTLLHFWATWCPPCIDEIPSLFQLAEDLSLRDDFALLMVAVDDEVEKVEGFLGSRSATALYDPNWDVAHRYDTRKLPETYLLVGNTVVHKFVGAQDWSDPKVRRTMAEKVREQMGEGAPDFGVQLTQAER